MNKLFTKIAALALGAAMMIGVGVSVGNKSVSMAAAGDELYKTVEFIQDNCTKTTGGYTATATYSDDIDVSCVNFNTNNTSWDYIKCGSKSAVSVAKIITDDPIDEAVTKVVISMSTSYSSYINSIKLYSSSDATSWDEISSFVKTTGDNDVSISSPSKNLYYKVEFDCKKGTKTTGNGFVVVTKIEYYKAESTDPGKQDSSVSITTTKPLNLTTNSSDVTLQVSKTPSNASITFSSSNTDVVTVGQSTGVVHVEGPGSATITATFAGDDDYNGSSDTISVSVTQAAPALVVGTISQFTSDTAGDNKQLYQITGIVTAWKSGETSGTQYGNFTITDSSGSVYIYGATADESKLSWDGTAGSYTWTTPTDFLTDPLTSTIVLGSQVTMKVTRKDYQGTPQGRGIVTAVNNTLPQISIDGGDQSVDIGDNSFTLTVSTANIGENQVTWSSSDTSVATINQTTGKVTPVAGGETDITASVTVENKEYTSTITLTVNVPTLTVGETIAIYYDTSYLTSIGFINTTQCGISGSEADAAVFTVEAGTAEGSFAFNLDGNYLAYTGTGNELNTLTTITAQSSWTVTGTSKASVIIANVNNTSRYLKYNTSAPRFACYTSSAALSLASKTPQADPTEVTLSASKLTLEQEASETLTFVADSKASAFKWHSSNTTIASVSGGVVTAGTTAGKANIYVYFDSNNNGQYDSTDSPQDVCEVTVTAPVIDYSSVSFGGIGTKITSANSSSLIANGKKIIFSYGTYIYGPYSTYLSTISNSEDFPISFSGNNVTIGDGSSELSFMILELESTNGGFYLKMKNGKYLGHTSSSSSAGNFAEDSTATKVWTISVDENGAASIYADGGTTRSYLRVNTGSSNRLKPYASSTGVQPTLYSLNEYTDEAIAYSEYFITSGGLSENHSCEDTITVWDDLGTYYTDTLSDGAKYLLRTATHLASEEYDDPDDYSIQHCVARYDDALIKHAELRTNEFMHRTTQGTLSYTTTLPISSILNGGNSTTVIIIISVIGVSALGGFFFLRKRKEI